MGKRTFMNGAYSRRGGRRQGGSRGGGIVGSLVPSLPVAGANHRWISTAGIIEDGNGVLTWEDVIGGVVLDRQGAAGATIAANALVKQPVVRFPGLGAATMSSDAIGGSSVFNAGNDFTVIAFASPSVLAGTKSFFSASAGAVATSEFNLRTNAGPNLVCVRNGSTTSISTAKVPTSTFSRMIVRWDDSADSFDFKTNGVDEPRANGGDPVAVQTRYTIGANATLIGNLAAGDLCEVIVYDRRLTDAEATAIDQYLVARYFETLIHELGAQAWWDTTDNSNISIDAGGVDVFTDRIGGVELLQGTPSARPTVEFSERLGHQAFRYD
ncbi:MAG: hypothetical protein O7B23_10745, partial [Deltaproteobacteria bacterium]|nr:hypothetical protein [Deltaproteobacteria bacterium]